MRTVDGHMIKLEQTKLGPDPEHAKKMMVYGPSLFPMLFILFPLFFLADMFGIPHTGIVLLVAIVGAFIGMTMYMKRLVDADDPAVQHKGALVFIHFRIFFASAILYFLCAGLSIALIAAVVVLWLFTELHYFATLRRVDDSAICAAYPVRFSRLDNGEWLYDSCAKMNGVLREPRYFSKPAEAFLIPTLVIAGGIIFVRSFALRNDFDTRFIIAGCVSLFLAMLVRSLVTQSVLDIRAVDLKAQGEF